LTRIAVIKEMAEPASKIAIHFAFYVQKLLKVKKFAKARERTNHNSTDHAKGSLIMAQSIAIFRHNQSLEIRMLVN